MLEEHGYSGQATEWTTWSREETKAEAMSQVRNLNRSHDGYRWRVVKKSGGNAAFPWAVQFKREKK